MAERYSTLPTHILQNATTLDMVIFDVAMSYRQYRANKNNPKQPADYSTSQLEEIMQKHKEKYGKN